LFYARAVRVFLLHGLGRTTASMTWLARKLRRAGHPPERFGYLVLTEDLESIAGRFAERVARVLAEDAAQDAARDAGQNPGRGDAGPPAPGYAVIGHSLGGIVARLAWPDLPAGLARFVMLAPPNRPPATVEHLGGNPLFRLLFRDAGRKLGDPGFYAALPRPEAPTLVVAGDRGLSARWLPFRGEPNDGIVRVAETVLPGAPLVLVRGAHTFIMNRRDVFGAVRQFLEADRLTGVGASGAPSTSPGTGC
jgi:hypothetical protein